jgi:hypothetical protein
MQFLGLTTSFMTSLVWKPWADPKCKIFASLILQNTVCPADRLRKEAGEIVDFTSYVTKHAIHAAQLLFKCSFTIHILVHLEELSWTTQENGVPMHNVKDWWVEIIDKKRLVSGNNP